MFQSGSSCCVDTLQSELWLPEKIESLRLVVVDQELVGPTHIIRKSVQIVRHGLELILVEVVLWQQVPPEVLLDLPLAQWLAAYDDLAVECDPLLEFVVDHEYFQLPVKLDRERVGDVEVLAEVNDFLDGRDHFLEVQVDQADVVELEDL